MALSNWDTMAFGPDGKPCNGTLKAIDGKGWVEIYKNWVYLHNPDMWVEGGCYVKDTIAEIRSGVITTLDHFTIHAARGRRQQAVYVLAYTWKYGKEPKDLLFKAMCGVGCYGWGDEIPKYARKMEVDVSKYTDVMSGSSYEGPGKKFHVLTCFKEDGTMEEFKTPRTPETEDELEAEFVGVEYETQEDFFNWLKNEIESEVVIFDRELKKWFEEVEKNRGSGLRFNQGDQYFATRLGFDTPATPVGEQQETILTGVLKEMQKKV